MDLARFIAGLFSPLRNRFSPSRNPEESESSWLGRYGEYRAARHLRRNRYKILYRNFSAPHGGEVDLVCRDGKVLVFVEVKTRRSLEFGAPADAVDLEKQRLISRGAIAWLRLLGFPEVQFRFDIVEVLMTGEATSFYIIKDAFQLPEPYRY